MRMRRVASPKRNHTPTIDGYWRRLEDARICICWSASTPVARGPHVAALLFGIHDGGLALCFTHIEQAARLPTLPVA